MPLAPSRPTTILLVDDHPVLRSGLRRILEAHHYQVVGEAGNAVDARRLLQQQAPTLVILDIGLPGVRGIELGAEILNTCPHTRVIFLTVHKEEEYVYQALAIGASGYVLKDCLDTEVLDAIRCVERGERYVTPLVSSALVRAWTNRMSEGFHSVFDGLTVRERQVVSLLCDGQSTKDVAATLCISTRTAEHHRQSVMKKLGVQSIAEFIKLAIKHKITEP
jgi:DNA-binding NarL/FixJ family response regulator